MFSFETATAATAVASTAAAATAAATATVAFTTATTVATAAAAVLATAATIMATATAAVVATADVAATAVLASAAAAAGSATTCDDDASVAWNIEQTTGCDTGQPSDSHSSVTGSLRDNAGCLPSGISATAGHIVQHGYNDPDEPTAVHWSSEGPGVT